VPGDDTVPSLTRHQRSGGGDVDRPLGGAHRADGLAGPPRRYLVIVVLLAGTASLPLVAAISAGPATVGGPALGDTRPFIAPPSEGPVVVPLPPAPTEPGPEPPTGGGPDPAIPTPDVPQRGDQEELGRSGPDWIPVGRPTDQAKPGRGPSRKPTTKPVPPASRPGPPAARPSPPAGPKSRATPKPPVVPPKGSRSIKGPRA
jgi:hypothetical protein